MAYIQKANLAYATVAIAPSPALSGTSLTLASGLGSLFPAANFTITVYPPINPLVPVNPLKSNAEICLCTSRTGDVLTIVRAQEGTTAKSIATGWQVANTATALNFTEIENSIIQRISAGSTFASASEVVFSNANGVSFGASGQTITASIATATQSTQPVAASASNGSFAFSTLGFTNANGVTFGTSAGSQIFASVAAGVAAGSLSAGTQSMALGQAVFSNSNGISFGLSNSTLTASHNGLTSQSNQAASASNGSFAFQTLGFSNANGVTFGSSAGSIITASVAAGAAPGSIAAGGSTLGLGQVEFSNANGISFSLAGSTITASHNGLTSQSAQAASASNGSFAFQTLAFSNANNVTFGTSAGSIITASVSPSGGGSINFSAGTTSNNLASVIFSDSNGVVFGLNAGTITASVTAGGGGAGTLSLYQPYGCNVVSFNAVGGNNQIYMAPLDFPCAVQFDRAVFPVSVAITAGASTGTLSQWIGFYTSNNSTFSLAHSSSTAQSILLGVANSASYTGVKDAIMGWTSTIGSGNYFVAYMSQASGVNFGVFNGMFVRNSVGYSGILGAASAPSAQATLGLGFFASTTGAMPNSIAMSDIHGYASNGNRVQVFHLQSRTV